MLTTMSEPGTRFAVSPNDTKAMAVAPNPEKKMLVKTLTSKRYVNIDLSAGVGNGIKYFQFRNQKYLMVGSTCFGSMRSGPTCRTASNVTSPAGTSPVVKISPEMGNCPCGTT